MSELLTTDAWDGFKRKIFLLPLDSLDALPTELHLPTPYFVLFIACNVTHLNDETIYEFAEKMIAFGAVYMCAWGQGCSRVDDAFDMVCVYRELSSDKPFPLIMTTWHANESLDQALWFALNHTDPDAQVADRCGSTLVVSVGNSNWLVHLQNRLANLEQLNEDVVFN